MDLLTEDDIEPPDAPYAVATLSDGTWEALVDMACSPDASPSSTLEPTLASLLGTALATLMNPDDQDAQAVAERIMTAARAARLDDNTTVAVACVTTRPATADSHDG